MIFLSVLLIIIIGTSVWAAVAPELENTGSLYLDDNSISVKKNAMMEIFTDYTGKNLLYAKDLLLI